MQILLFATLAIELKRRAPNAHTFLEVIKARYGTAAHVTFMVFGLVTNILVSLMLIVGGSATVNALTGMHTIAAIYLLPVGVVAYTMVGGLKATILTDWVHTFILLVIIIVFALSAYASSDVLGSPSVVYDLLVEAAGRHPVDGNKDGSYLTMQSREGAIFFVINIVGNFGTVFLDNGYYNKGEPPSLPQPPRTLLELFSANPKKPSLPRPSMPCLVTSSVAFRGLPSPG